MREFKGYMHGINLGGWFSQCDHSEKRYDYFVRHDDFKRIASWGFDHVRIPVDYELILNEDGSFNESGFARLGHCIEWSEEAGLNMILDLHKTPGFSFDLGENEDGFFVNGRYQKLFCDIWKEFAVRFGHCRNLSFELLNEVSDPAFSDKWNEISRRAVIAIREYAPDIHILIGGYYNNSVTAVKDLDIPFDSNIVYNFHCYSPLAFTHQGAYWLSSMDRDFRTGFEKTFGEYARMTEEQIGPGFVEKYPSDNEVISQAYFDALFSEAVKIAEERDVPLYCGEYGVIDLADPEETVKWFECIHSVFEKYGIGRAIWSYKEMDFGLVDAHYDPVRDKILELK